jgi:outer membrane biosynthesis protein TonB
VRKFVLIAAMVLVSATAQAGESRGLSLVSVETPAAPAQQPAAAEPVKVQTAQTTETATPAAPPAETPKFVERPAAIDTTTTPPAQPKADSAKPVPQAKADTKADRPRHKKYWTEARIIGELHRHGIYW